MIDDASTTTSHSPSMVRRLSRTVGVSVMSLASLLTFPAGITVMVAGWLLLASLSLIAGRERQTGAILATLAILLLIKQPEHSERFYLLVTAIFYSAAAATWHPNPRSRAIEIAVLWLIFAWFGVGRYLDANGIPSQASKVNPVIVCLGDSLTEFGYPEELQTMVGVPVVNFGRNGYTTTEAIKDLLPQIVQRRPRVVVLELGGHDYKNGKPRQHTEQQLTLIIESIQRYGGDVVIVEIPRGFISDPYSGLERDLAREYDLELISDTIIRRFIFSGPSFPPGSWLAPEQRLSDDNLHPNKLGNRAFAESVKSALESLYSESDWWK